MVAVISPRFSLHNTLIIWAAKNCSYFSALGQPHKSECFPKLLSILYRSYILLFPIYAIVQQLLSAIASTISQKHFYILIPSTFGRCLPRSTPSVPPKPTTCFTPIPENHVWIVSRQAIERKLYHLHDTCSPDEFDEAVEEITRSLSSTRHASSMGSFKR